MSITGEDEGKSDGEDKVEGEGERDGEGEGESRSKGEDEGRGFFDSSFLKFQETRELRVERERIESMREALVRCR